MILDRLKTRICRLICPHAACESDPAGEERLDRAEALHRISSTAARKETAVVKKRVGDMRVVANSAVQRLRHERGEIEVVEQ
jgi:hypothetical protein